MIEVVPAVLAKSWGELTDSVELVHAFAKSVQIDVVDGHFVRHKTWPYKDRATFDKIVKEERGLPHWEKLDFEFDLMINDPAAEVGNFVRAGASRIVLHASAPGTDAALESLADMREPGGEFYVRVGIALSIGGEPHELERLQPDFVQVMGIEHIGKQGEPLHRRAVYLIERVRRLYPAMQIQVDGGVRAQNIQQLVAAGANRIIAGSAILGADDPEAAYKELVALANA